MAVGATVCACLSGGLVALFVACSVCGIANVFRARAGGPKTADDHLAELATALG